MLRFIRTTHDEQGQWRPLTPEAWQFWQREGWLVVQHLPEEVGLTLAEVVVACREYGVLTAGERPLSIEDERYVAWLLVRLVELGLVTAVVDSPAFS